MAGRPPGADVRMSAAPLRHQNIPESLPIRRLSIVEIFQPVHILKIEREGTFRAVNFDGDMVFASEGKPGRLEVGQSAILKAADEYGGIINRYFAHSLSGLSAEALAFAALVHERTFLDESMHQATNFFEF